MMAEFVNAICGIPLPEPILAVFCIMFILLFISFIFSALKAVFGR